MSHIVIYLFVGLLAWAAFEDARDFLIPNKISAAIAALYPAYVLSQGEFSAILPDLAVGFGVLALGLVAFTRGLMGGGDVKLMAAIAIWAGPSLVLPFLFMTAIAGGVLSLALIAPRLLSRGDTALARPLVPYGIAVAAGGLYVASRHLAGV